MNRYNIFYQIHKGLRALLFDTGNFLQKADFCNGKQLDEIRKRINEVQHLFDKHAHTEDSFVLPAIEMYEPAVVDAFEKEHQEDVALGHKLKNILTALADADNEYDRMELGKSLNIVFAEFTIFNLSHMAKEEKVLNGFLWRYYGDNELKQLSKKIVTHIHPGDADLYNKWMLRGLNKAEIVSWLKIVVKNGAPDHVFKALMKQASEEIDEQTWREVQEQLSEGLLLATD